MPDPRASQLPSPTHVLCKVFVLLTKAPSHNIASTPSQTATHGTQQGEIRMAKQRALRTVCKRLPKPVATSDSSTFCELTIAQIASDSDSTLAIHMQQESIPFRSALIRLEGASSPTPCPALRTSAKSPNSLFFLFALRGKIQLNSVHRCLSLPTLQNCQSDKNVAGRDREKEGADPKAWIHTAR